MATDDGPVKIGFVGAGGVSQVHAPAYQYYGDRVRLSAVCDVNEEAARKLAETIGPDVDVYIDLDQMLARADIEAVDICTPHFLHAPQTIAAADAGKHVLVEKPMACSVDESRAMVSAAEKAGTTLMVAQYLRYLPAYIGVKRLIERGGLGRVWWARSDDWFASSNEGSNDDSWTRDAKRAGGGVLHMGGTHHVDLFRFYFGEVRSVRAYTWTDNPRFKNGAEDRAVATLEFESGVIAQLTACYAPYPTPHMFQHVILGQDGALQTTFPQVPEGILLDIPTELLAVMRPMAEHQAPAVVSTVSGGRGIGDAGFLPVPEAAEDVAGTDPWANEILHFADCVRTATEPISSGRDNVETMRVVYACYESASSGREVLLR